MLLVNDNCFTLSSKKNRYYRIIVCYFFSRFLYAYGKNVWRKWKKRYFVLVQVSQYTFAMCSYKEKKSEPSEMLQLDSYTVDYIERASGNFYRPVRTCLTFFKTLVETNNSKLHLTVLISFFLNTHFSKFDGRNRYYLNCKEMQNAHFHKNDIFKVSLRIV